MVKGKDMNSNAIDSLLINVPAADSAQGLAIVNTNPSASFGIMMFQMLFTLLIMSVVLYIALYFFRRVNAQFKHKNKAINFKLHENLYFTSKQGISAVQFGDRLYIIGFSGNSVNLIDVINDKEIIAQFESVQSVKPDFMDTLKKYFFKGQK